MTWARDMATLAETAEIGLGSVAPFGWAGFGVTIFIVLMKAVILPEREKDREATKAISANAVESTKLVAAAVADCRAMSDSMREVMRGHSTKSDQAASPPESGGPPPNHRSRP